MRALVTGSTGLVGNAIARALHTRGHQVRALVRDVTRARTMLHADIELVVGDITVPASLPPAMRDIDIVFHAAGMPEQWARDPAIFERVNTHGTANVLSAARAAGVQRAIHTSTMDVFRLADDGFLREDSPDPEPKHSAYERSKQHAEEEVDRIRADGLEVVVLNPASVYGPSPVGTGMTEFFVRMLSGKVPMVPPGGVSLAFVESVADAHIAAADRGIDGERYLLADGFVTMQELAEITARVAGLTRIPKTAPVWVLRAAATLGERIAKVTHAKPMITHDALQFLLWRAKVDASKARAQLGYAPPDIEDGVRRTVESLRASAVGREDRSRKNPDA